MFVQHDFKVLEDIWFTLAPELTVQAVEVLKRIIIHLQSVLYFVTKCVTH